MGRGKESFREYLGRTSEGGKTNLLHAARDFYVLDALANEIRKARGGDKFRHGLKKLGREVMAYKKEFDQKLGKVLYDYLVIASIGESGHNDQIDDTTYRHWVDKIRHNKLTPDKVGQYYGQSTPKIEFYNKFKFYINHNRPFHRGGENIKQYDPKKALPIVSDLFDLEWRSGYGGSKWKKIADSAMLYWKLPVASFIDHVIDLAHNNNVAFDKGFLVDVHDLHKFKNFLDWKSNKGQYHDAPPADVLKGEIPVTPNVYWFFHRARSFGLVNPPDMPKISQGKQNIKFPEPVKFGNRELK